MNPMLVGRTGNLSVPHTGTKCVERRAIYFTVAKVVSSVAAAR